MTRTFFLDSPVMHVLFDSDGIIKAANREFVEQLGRERIDFDGDRLPSLVHPDDVPFFRQFLDECRAPDRRTARSEFRFVRDDGSTLWALLSVRKTEDETGAPILLGALDDITDHREFEDKLHRHNQTLVKLTASPKLYGDDFDDALREITEAAGKALRVRRAGIWFFNLSGDAIRCADMFDQEENTHSGDTVLVEADAPRYFQTLKEGVRIAAHDALTDPRTNEFRDAYLSVLGITSMLDAPIRADGRLVGVVCHEHVGPPRRWTPDEETFAVAVASLVGIALEASRRRETERALQRSEKYYRSLIENTSDIVTILDRRGVIQYESPSILKVLGFSPEELAGRNAFEFVHPDDFERIQERFRRGVRNGPEATPIEYRCKCKDGSWKILESIGRDMLDDPVVSGLVIQSRDITERKTVEKTLGDLQTKLLAILEQTAEVIFIKDTEGRYILMNPAGCRLFDLTPDMVVGKTDFELFSPEEAADIWEIDRRVRETGIPFSHESGRVYKGGKRTFSTTKVPYVSDRGEVLGVIGFSRDITERTRIEKALRLSEERYRDLFENANDIIYTQDLQGNYTSANRAARDVTGFSEDEAGKLNMAHLIAPEYVETSRKMMIDKLAGKSDSTTYELDIITKDGRRLPVEVSTRLLYEGGKPVGVQGMARDISERKRMEAELKRSEEHFRALIDASTDIITVLDFDGTIRYESPSAYRLTGWSPEDLLGRNVMKFVHPDDLPDVVKEIMENFQVGKVGEPFEYRCRTRDGRWLTLESTAQNLSTNPAVNGIVVNSRDITQRKAAEKELKRAKEAAEAANRAKSDFLANMSHEIRTPMNGIIGMTDLLLDTPLNAEQREFAETVRQSSEGLLTVINDVLDFSKIEAGKLELEKIDFSPRRTVENVFDLLGRTARHKHLEFTSVIASDVPEVLVGDQGRLRQILLNLVGNAVKFTPSGEISLRVEALEVAASRIVLQFKVADTGIGIAPEVCERLFQPFSQADSSTTRRFGGTGLGLAICKRLVEMMNGSIEIESQLGRGSTFRFTAEFEPSATEGRLPARAPLRNARVLVVDDNESVRMMTSSILELLGASPETASDGQSALDLLDAAAENGNRFDAAVLDLKMPGINGFELSARIKARFDPAPKLVLLTGCEIEDYPDVEQVPPIDAYLTKPVQVAEVADCLTKLLTASPAARPAFGPPAAETIAHRILVAEDNAINQKVVVRQLAKLGFQADLVSNGKEAVEAVNRADYALVLMDCQMPEMDGFAATAEIRRLESTRRDAPSARLPIVALTANVLRGERERCLEAGMDDYLAKPVKPEQLAETLARLLPQT